jgi:hypothetical protein
MAETLTINLEATPATEAPDLMGALGEAEETVLMELRLADYVMAFTSAHVTVDEQGRVKDQAQPSLPPNTAEAKEGFRAAFQWARRQTFDPDHAQRMRREAWGE